MTSEEPAIDATCLMILTGWRRGEVLGLRWSETDLPRRTARLADSKAGASLRAFSEHNPPADLTPYVLRHSFASLAADLGYNEPTIASLLGHRTHSITSRYMHSADAVLLAAANAVANATMKLMASDQPHNLSCGISAEIDQNSAGVILSSGFASVEGPPGGPNGTLIPLHIS